MMDETVEMHGFVVRTNCAEGVLEIHGDESLGVREAGELAALILEMSEKLRLMGLRKS